MPPAIQPAAPGLPPTTCEQLVAALLRTGGRVISRQPHGVLMKVRQRLVFIPSTPWLPEGTVVDALRAAELTREQFLELRASGR